MKRGGGMQNYPPQCGKEHLTSEGFEKILNIKANIIDYKIKKYIYLYDKFDQLWYYHKFL